MRTRAAFARSSLAFATRRPSSSLSPQPSPARYHTIGISSPSISLERTMGVATRSVGSAHKRRSPRLNPSLLLAPSARSLSTSDSSSESASSTKKSVMPKATTGRTRGRPRKSAAVVTDESIASDSATSTTSSSAASDRSSSRKRRKSLRVKKAAAAKESAKTNTARASEEPATAQCLPRTRELALKTEFDNDNLLVVGVDEAGRGPLAGPVCAAAAILPVDIAGITDSKKITKEEAREELYEKIMGAPGVRWAAAIVDAKRIDEINILQATMEAMRMAASAVICPPTPPEGRGKKKHLSEASADRLGCYVVCGANNDDGNPMDPTVAAADAAASSSSSADPAVASYYALIDGNRVPNDMECEAEPLIKGDSKEFCIGAASIIAKVTRDRLMHAYDTMYPEYNLKQHKGYPTAAHMTAVRTHGASPIHRRTFAPLKHMSFHEDGRIVEDA